MGASRQARIKQYAAKTCCILIAQAQNPMHILDLDHLVLTVKNLDATIRFYTTVLGMEAVTFGDNRHALVFGDKKINLHPLKSDIQPRAHAPKAGSADLCFRLATPIEEVIAELQQHGITIESGPVRRTGAYSALISVYLRDPDQNLIELSNVITM